MAVPYSGYFERLCLAELFFLALVLQSSWMVRILFSFFYALVLFLSYFFMLSYFYFVILFVIPDVNTIINEQLVVR